MMQFGKGNVGCRNEGFGGLRGQQEECRAKNSTLGNTLGEEGSGELAVLSADELTSVGEVRVEPGASSAGDVKRFGCIKHCARLDPQRRCRGYRHRRRGASHRGPGSR